MVRVDDSANVTSVSSDTKANAPVPMEVTLAGIDNAEIDVP